MKTTSKIYKVNNLFSLFIFALLISFIFAPMTGCSDDNRVNNRSIPMIKPIAEFQNYFFTDNGNLSGLSSIGVSDITVLDEDDQVVRLFDFFKKSDDLYFHIKETDENGDVQDKYFKQSGGSITSITSLPTKPTISRSRMDNNVFKIVDFQYEDIECSDVHNLNTGNFERMKMVDGFSYFENYGFFFAVSDGRYDATHMVRENGLYFWPLNRTSVTRVKDQGVMW